MICFSMKIIKFWFFNFKQVPVYLFFISCFINVLGQEEVKLSKPQLQVVNDSLIIEYNILSGNQADKFNIRLKITDTTGTIIIAKALYGDIGDSVSTGFNKKIVWNLAVDNVYINRGINIEILAKKLSMPVTVSVEKMDKAIIATTAENKEVSNEKSLVITDNPKKMVHSAGTGKNILLSAILPGSGLTRLSNGKPYWIIGIVDAGCIATSFYFNKKSSSNYNRYLNSSDAVEFDPYYDLAIRQQALSKVFAWSAFAIWAIDMGIVSSKAAKKNKALKNNKMSSFKIGSSIDYYSATTCLSFYLNF